MSIFKLCDYRNVSNRSVPLGGISKLIGQIKGIFLDGEKCCVCKTPIKGHSVQTWPLLERQQCSCRCSRCKKIFHFLCYLDEIAARKSAGALFLWPENAESPRGWEYAVCPSCKTTGACQLVVDGKTVLFVESEYILWDMEKN